MLDEEIIYNDYWNRIQEKDKEIERLNNIIKELKAILKSKGYETYIPALERSDKE